MIRQKRERACYIPRHCRAGQCLGEDNPSGFDTSWSAVEAPDEAVDVLSAIDDSSSSLLLADSGIQCASRLSAA